MLDNHNSLYEEFEYCCSQWKQLLYEAYESNKAIANILSLVSIKTFDRDHNYILLVYNPKHKLRIQLFDSNPIIIQIIQKYFGRVNIKFEENRSIVDPQDIKEIPCQMKQLHI